MRREQWQSLHCVMAVFCELQRVTSEKQMKIMQVKASERGSWWGRVREALGAHRVLT